MTDVDSNLASSERTDNQEFDIPHGHGASFKKGVVDGLMDQSTTTDALPNGHFGSYKRGKSFGVELKGVVARNVR